jgi:hypothetical protein
VSIIDFMDIVLHQGFWFYHGELSFQTVQFYGIRSAHKNLFCDPARMILFLLATSHAHGKTGGRQKAAA